MKYNSIGEQLIAKAKEIDPNYKPDKFNDMSEAIDIILNNSGGGQSIPVVEATFSDETFTIDKAQTTPFILHSSDIGYVFMNNLNGAYSGMILISSSACYTLMGNDTKIMLGIATINATVTATLEQQVGNLYSFNIPEEQFAPFILDTGSFLLPVFPTDISYTGSLISSDSNGFYFLSVSGKGTNIIIVKSYLSGTISTIILPSTLTITSTQFDDLISSPNSFLVFYDNAVSNSIVYNNKNELVISFITTNVRENNILYTDLIYTASQLTPTIKYTLTKMSKSIPLFTNHSVLVPSDSTDTSILSLPADASTSTYVLKAVNGTVQWVKEA